VDFFRGLVGESYRASVVTSGLEAPPSRSARACTESDAMGRGDGPAMAPPPRAFRAVAGGGGMGTMAVLVVAVACALCMLPGMGPGGMEGGAGMGPGVGPGGRGLMSDVPMVPMGGGGGGGSGAGGGAAAYLSSAVWSPSAAIAHALHASGALSHVVALGLGAALLVLLALLLTSLGARVAAFAGPGLDLGRVLGLVPGVGSGVGGGGGGGGRGAGKPLPR
jgi:hypothetical protein